MALQASPSKTREILSLSSPPGRAALARAIAALDVARARLDQAHQPMRKLDEIRAAATCSTAAGLREEVARLRAAHESEIVQWVEAGAGGPRPVPGAELLDAEHRLAEIAGVATAAEKKLSIMREGYTGAAERARAATLQRDRALWPAAVEAAECVLDDVRRAVPEVRTLEGTLRSLVAALRVEGNRDPVNGDAALAAASKIEEAICATRRTPSRVQAMGCGRDFL